jgi:hypothetical protein
MSPDLRQELERLLSALCDGALTEAEHARLQELLDSNPDCRRCYLEYLDMHARLLAHPRLGEADLLPAGEPRLGRGTTSAASETVEGPLAPQAPVPAPPEAPPPPAAPTRRSRVSQALRYGMVAAGSVAASVLVQLLWLHPQPAGDRGQPVGPAAGEPTVATLIGTADGAWEDRRETLRTGSRLAPGPLRLQKGLARIRFDTGSEVLLEGPADLSLDSGTAATLRSGKAVVSRDGMAVPFDMHTLSATVVDLGTEYGIAVGADGDQIQVFEGEVQRVPRVAAGAGVPEYLKAGEARRWLAAPPGPGQPVAFDPARFVRRLAAAGQPPDPATGLLAYEGFDYAAAELFTTGKADGGFGWAGPWTVTAARPLEWGDNKQLPLNVKDSLVRYHTPAASVGGRFEHGGFGVYYRRLQAPIRLDIDGCYYVSALFRRSGPSGHPHNVVALMLRPDAAADTAPEMAKRLMLGVGGSNQVFTRLGRECAHASLPIASGTIYLLVAKVAASRTAADQVFVRVYGPREPVGGEETASWTVVSPAFRSDLSFEWLGIHVNSKHRQMVDEIRVGTTWSSVTAPWVAPAVATDQQP